jgi:mannose-6-phosphate isomerase
MYEESIINGNLPELIYVESAEPGDTFFTPAGRIHAIGKGIVLVEIQQTSDLTYRISDWNRKSEGNVKRELHLDLALEAMDFTAAGKTKINKPSVLNKTDNLVSCEYFTTNVLRFNTLIKKNYYPIDSFVVYICVEGAFELKWDSGSEKVTKGETVLLPAMIHEIRLEPAVEAKILEVFINSNNLTY